MSLLGKPVTDKITGLTGVVTQEVQSLNGNYRYTVQPVSSDPTKVLDSWTLDQQGLEVVLFGVGYDPLEPVPHDIELGDTVKNIITDKSGVVMAFATYLNGCVSAMVSPMSGGEDIWVSVQVLKPTGQNLGILQTGTGGPATKGLAQRY